MQETTRFVKKNAKAIVAAIATLVAGAGLNIPPEAQAAIVTLLVWLIPNTDSNKEAEATK